MMNIRNVLHSGDVVRYHNHVGIDKQKNSEHQWGVALILQHIYPECSKSLLLAALTHDAHEYLVGDIPAPIKWDNPELGSILKAMELKWEEKNGVKFVLNWEETLILKIADTLEGMWFCVHQVRNGHINAKRPYRKWREFIIGFITEHERNASEKLKLVFALSVTLLNRIVREMEEL